MQCPAGSHTIRASDLAAPVPTVRLDTPAIEAARLLGGQDLPGLIVLDDKGYGRHLYERVSTGTTCRYDPDPDNPVHWALRAPT